MCLVLTVITNKVLNITYRIFEHITPFWTSTLVIFQSGELEINKSRIFTPSARKCEFIFKILVPSLVKVKLVVIQAFDYEKLEALTF